MNAILKALRSVLNKHRTYTAVCKHCRAIRLRSEMVETNQGVFCNQLEANEEWWSFQV